MRMPKVLFASLLHRRPCGTLEEFLAQAKIQTMELSYFFVLHTRNHDERRWIDYSLGHTGIHSERFNVQTDIRHVDGRGSEARRKGETQRNLAYLRNVVLDTFQESNCDYLFFVDSDIVLHPGATVRAVVAAELLGDQHTVSLQVDNRVARHQEPITQASYMGTRVPWATSGLTRVTRSGACTLYPRSVLCRRFYAGPDYVDEHDWFFDELTRLGFEHWLVQETEWTRHTGFLL